MFAWIKCLFLRILGKSPKNDRPTTFAAPPQSQFQSPPESPAKIHDSEKAAMPSKQKKTRQKSSGEKSPLRKRLCQLVGRLNRRVSKGKSLSDCPRKLKAEFLECLGEFEDRILRSYWPSIRNRLSEEGKHKKIPVRIWKFLLRREAHSPDSITNSRVPSVDRLEQRIKRMSARLLN